MKKILLLIAFGLIGTACFAQFNYSFTNAKFTTGSYTDISSTGTTINMTDAESGSSVTPVNIGFNFNFNGTLFTECMIHADGILKFGSIAPGISTLIAPSPLNSYTNVMTNTTSAFQNIVMPLFCDLVQGIAAPQYHVLTTGAAPNRITTIQWKNLRDADNPASTLQHQFANMEFQIKLYETTNDIEVVYGTWIPSANGALIRGTCIGVKANSTNFISYTKISSLLAFDKGDFTDPALTAIGRLNYLEKAVVPTIGTSFRYFSKLPNDVNVAELYVDDAVPQNTSITKNIQVLIKNEGTNVASAIPVTLTVSGANTFTETISITSLAAGSSQLLNFSAFVAANKGLQIVSVSVNPATDDRVANNSLEAKQTISQSHLKNFNENKKSFNGFGFNGSSNMIATKMFGSGTRSISQVRAYFTSYQVQTDLRIYEDDGGGGSPGTLLYTSPIFRTDEENTSFIPTPNISVTGDYYVAFAQRETLNMGLGYFIQYPKLTQKQYNSPTDFTSWAEATTPFNANIAVFEQKNAVDIGVEKITGPLCLQTSNEVVKATIRNFSSQVHDYATNPVTIAGFVRDEVNNTSIPFTILKNSGTIAAGGRDTVILLNGYNFTSKGNHLFTANTICATDGEPLNDSINFNIATNVLIRGAPADSVCPNTTITLTNSSTSYLRFPYEFSNSDGSTIPFASTTLTVKPTVTTAYYLSGVDYRGCTLRDSVVIKVRSLNVPPAPAISSADTILSYRNDFTAVLLISPLAGHSITWQSGGTITNAGSTNTVAPASASPVNSEMHTAFYTRIADGCSGLFSTPVTTIYATGILINNNTVTTICDTSFYDDGGVNAPYSTSSYTKTYIPTDAGKKLKLTINKFNFGQFSLMRIYDGTSTSAPIIGRLDRFTAASDKYEFVASNPAGIITIDFSGNSINAAGFIGGITCQTPLQFRTNNNGIFTNAAIWESRPVGSINFAPATRIPNKGDDSIWIFHTIDYNKSIPLDQVVIEATGNLELTGTDTRLDMYKTLPANELTIKGTFKTNTGTFFGSNSTNIVLLGTLINNIEMQADSLVVADNSTAALISGNGLIPKLIVNNAMGLIVNGNLDISRELNLKKGVIKVNISNYIRLKAGLGPIITGGNGNSYVDGKLRRQVFSSSDSIYFPVGKNNIYRKFILLAIQTSFDDFVEYEAELFIGAPPARTLPASFTNINQQWYHNVKITGGNSNFSDATATIYYEANDGITNPADLRIGKDDGSANWLNIGGTGTGTPAGSITSNSFTSFSDFVLANIPGGSLPVTLLGFSGNLSNNTVQLNWKVTNEISFAGYAIERSTDASSFTKIGFLQARGFSTEGSYQYLDVQLPAGQEIFYRLKMTDHDGRFSYSKVIRVKLNGQLSNRIITITPNPFINNIGIQIQSAGNQNIQLQLLDMSGKLLKENRYAILPGINQLVMQTGDLPKGMYLLKILTSNKVITEKVLKQ